MAGIFDCKQSEADASARFAAKEYIDRIRQLEADLAAAREDVARMDWLDANRMIYDMVLRNCTNQLPPRAAIDAARAGGGR